MWFFFFEYDEETPVDPVPIANMDWAVELTMEGFPAVELQAEGFPPVELERTF